ncbi:MAG: hypothetical protein ACRD5Z_08600 [Bryobacteraceae bacterium]
MACDTELRLAKIPAIVRERAGLDEIEQATFTQVDGPYHRDAVKVRNGTILTLQQLGPGVIASVANSRPAVNIVPAAPAREREFA